MVSIHAPVKVRRHRFCLIWHHLQSFNPRTREGATELNNAAKQLESVSIHAPVKVRPVSVAAVAVS